MKRHAILGRKLHCPRTEALKNIYLEAADLRIWRNKSADRQFAREQEIGTPVILASFEHLGYGPINDLREQLNQGVVARSRRFSARGDRPTFDRLRVFAK